MKVVVLAVVLCVEKENTPKPTQDSIIVYMVGFRFFYIAVRVDAVLV